MTNAVIWLADEQHQEEVARSQDSVKAVMPTLKQISWAVPHKHPLWYVNWIDALIKSLVLPVERFVFFDSDVYAVAPFADIFKMLDRFDIASTHAPARQTTDMPFDMPGAFCEMNTGVFAYRNGPAVARLLDCWRENLIINAKICGDNDQAALRIALWEMSDVKVWVMPPEYNCRFGFGGFAAGEVKLLHGRSPQIKTIAQHINLDHTMRTWARGFYQ